MEDLEETSVWKKWIRIEKGNPLEFIVGEFSVWTEKGKIRGSMHGRVFLEFIAWFLKSLNRKYLNFVFPYWFSALVFSGSMSTYSDSFYGILFLKSYIVKRKWWFTNAIFGCHSNFYHMGEILVILNKGKFGWKTIIMGPGSN